MKKYIILLLILSIKVNAQYLNIFSLESYNIDSTDKFYLGKIKTFSNLNPKLELGYRGQIKDQSQWRLNYSISLLNLSEEFERSAYLSELKLSKKFGLKKQSSIEYGIGLTTLPFFTSREDRLLVDEKEYLKAQITFNKVITNIDGFNALFSFKGAILPPIQDGYNLGYEFSPSFAFSKTINKMYYQFGYGLNLTTYSNKTQETTINKNSIFIQLNY